MSFALSRRTSLGPSLLLGSLIACSSTRIPEGDPLPYGGASGHITSLGGATAGGAAGDAVAGTAVAGTAIAGTLTDGGTGAGNGGDRDEGGSADAVAGQGELAGATVGGQAAGGKGGNPDAGNGGASGGAANCGFEPVTPNATAATRRVLCYLHSIYGNHILSGQEENNDDNSLNAIVSQTGKYPAIRAFDVNNAKAPTQCVDHWKQGGLCMFGYHMRINGEAYANAQNIDNVLTNGTSENTSFKQGLDRIASFVQPLQDAGGVAIMRPFHEAGKSCSWFWWTKGTAEQWQALFKYEFDYLTATKGLKNMLWIAPLCGSPDAAHDPGGKYIDMGGADAYSSAGDYQPLTNLFHSTETAFPGMMVALHECGPIPDPDQLKSSATKWLFFNVWSGQYIDAPNNSVAHLKAVYASDYVITRDELPSFK